MIAGGAISRIHQRMGTVASGFEVAACLEAAAAIEADLIQLTGALTESQFHAPPRTGGWSVGFCIEHLLLTGQTLLPRWEIALKDAANRNLHGEERYQYRWWQRKLLEYVEDPSTFRRKTAPTFVPYSRRTIGDTVGRFLRMHEEFANTVAAARGLDVRRTKVQSPFVSWIRYAVGFSFDLALAHERRHLAQARRISRQLLNQP
jgi:hypothetical protein